ncbi:Flp pilus assembly protein CpaB [Thioclava sp. BHET1]|nr:Flp pilus assembly protein CpaB [Thioclava sp. BHET1]
MRMVFGLVLIAGLALAGFAVYMAKGIINQNAAALAQERARNVPSVPLTKVYVAKAKLAYGAVLKPDDVIAIEWQKNAVPKNAFTDLKQLFPNGGDKDRVVLRETDQFEPILTNAVTQPGQDAGITSRLSAGMRAFAIKVDVASGVSGFLRPSDHVDVYWTGRGTDGDVTRLIEPGVKVIAVDQTANTSQNTGAIIARTITVEASPQQVATLAQAQATGRLALSLLGTADTTVASAVEVDTNHLLGVQDKVAAPAPAPKKVCTVRQRNGSKVVDVPIPCTDN